MKPMNSDWQNPILKKSDELFSGKTSLCERLDLADCMKLAILADPITKEPLTLVDHENEQKLISKDGEYAFSGISPILYPDSIQKIKKNGRLPLTDDYNGFVQYALLS